MWSCFCLVGCLSGYLQNVTHETQTEMMQRGNGRMFAAQKRKSQRQLNQLLHIDLRKKITLHVDAIVAILTSLLVTTVAATIDIVIVITFSSINIYSHLYID